MNNIPIFTISLDFELYWGSFDKQPLLGRLDYYENTRKAIPLMLDLFGKEGVHVSWATVGMLFAQSWEEWERWMPQEVPSYKRGHLSSYKLKEKFAAEKEYTPCFFAPFLVEQIRDTPFQELGTHTFSHYYCQEAGQTPAQFRADLQAAAKAASGINTKLQSLVFPRNQYNEEYLKVCFEEGITSVRSNPRDWFWKETVEDKLMKKVFRTGDGYIPLGHRTSYPISSLRLQEGLPLSIPASRLLRPVHSDNKLLNALRLRRVLREMTLAAKAGECYHLWWHPHNFGNDPQKSMEDLHQIVGHYKQLEKRYCMRSMHMTEMYQHLKAHQQ